MMVLVILAFGSLAFFQVPRLIRARQKKELVWFCVFFLTGFALCIMLSAGVKITGPVKLVMDFLDAIGLHY
jgi:hypothetical protein